MMLVHIGAGEERKDLFHSLIRQPDGHIYDGVKFVNEYAFIEDLPQDFDFEKMKNFLGRFAMVTWVMSRKDKDGHEDLFFLRKGRRQGGIDVYNQCVEALNDLEQSKN